MRSVNQYTQTGYAISKLEAGPQTLVYIDGGNSHWQAVPTIAVRLVQAGIQNAQGFFTNVSNFNLNNYQTKYDTWASWCLAFGSDPEEGGWRLGNYSYCASQYYSYYSPFGPVSPDDISTWDIQTSGFSRTWEQPYPRPTSWSIRAETAREHSMQCSMRLRPTISQLQLSRLLPVETGVIPGARTRCASDGEHRSRNC